MISTGHATRLLPRTARVRRGTQGSQASGRQLARHLAPLVVIALLLAIQPLRPVVVEGHSMEPTLSPGQLLVETRSWQTIERGDIVIARVGKRTLIKRVAYLPGQSVVEAGTPGDWIILPPSWRTPRQIQSLSRTLRLLHSPSRVRTLVVPPNHVFLLGDNGPDSIDSRQFGPIPFSAIRGKVLQLDAPAASLHGIKPDWSW